MLRLHVAPCACNQQPHAHVTTAEGVDAAKLAFFSCAAIDVWLKWQQEFVVFSFEHAALVAAAEAAGLPVELTADDVIETMHFVHSLLDSIPEAPEAGVH